MGAQRCAVADTVDGRRWEILVPETGIFHNPTVTLGLVASSSPGVTGVDPSSSRGSELDVIRAAAQERKQHLLDHMQVADEFLDQLDDL